MRSIALLGLVTLALVLSGCEGKARQEPGLTTFSPQYGNVVLAADTSLPPQTAGKLEVAALIYNASPTGVAVSRTGRIFVCFPRWSDPIGYTVGEIKSGIVEPYPTGEINNWNSDNAQTHFVSVQSLVIDPKDRLWILDTGSINFGVPQPGAAKLLCYDLNENKVVKSIIFPPNIVLSTTYLNDVRFDMNRGKEGTAFITDSSNTGPNAIIVVDLASGQSRRRLEDHPSTKAQPQFLPIVEGRALMIRPPGNPAQYITTGIDGIALSSDHQRLFYCPLASRHLYSVRINDLVNGNMFPSELASSVQDLGERTFASDGLLEDVQGRLYLTDYENDAIRRRNSDGTYEIIAQDPRIIWPDSMAMGNDGFLYFTANQVSRMSRFHEGNDLRQAPYVVFRTRVEAGPVTMK